MKSGGENVSIRSRKTNGRTKLTVGVVLVVIGLEDVEGGDEDVVGGTELELDDEEPPVQGSEDSKSVATYRLSADRPPQSSLESPVHFMLHLELSKGRVPLPNTTPQ